MSKRNIIIGIWVIIILVIGIVYVTEEIEYKKNYVNDNRTRLATYDLMYEGKIRKIVFFKSGTGNAARLAVDRQGTYTVNSEHTIVICKFYDGNPPYQLRLEPKGKRMTLIDEDATVYTEDPYLYK